MKCPECGGAEMVHDTRDVEYIYKGKVGKFKVTGDFCPACGEVVMKMDEVERYGQMLDEFHQKVNASIFDPFFIMKVRRKLKMGQKEAGEIFGGGVNAFSRYERGRAEPPLALIKLFKVLDNHPELIDEIR